MNSQNLCRSFPNWIRHIEKLWKLLHLEDILVNSLFLMVFIFLMSVTDDAKIQKITRVSTYPSYIDSSLPIGWTDEPLWYLCLWWWWCLRGCTNTSSLLLLPSPAPFFLSTNWLLRLLCYNTTLIFNYWVTFKY